ncbi:hypothetical protein ACKLNO_07285 [Neisseriaceae bacterium B1]
MSKVENKKRGLTFGNILLTLLVIGTFAVMGLMAKLYIELTKTPEKTAQMHEEQQKQQVEVMSPNAQPGDKPVYRDANAQAASKPMTQPALQQTMQTAAASQVVPESEIKEAALNSGAVPIKKPAAPVKKVNKTEVAAEKPLKPINEVSGEVQLRPTNVPTRAAAPAELGERPLKPQPARNTEKSKSGDNIGELF